MREAGLARRNPVVMFAYFALVLSLSMTVMHPVCLGVSLLCALIWAFRLSGKRFLSFALKFLLPIMLVAAVMNPLFNHRGVTILAYFPGGNPLTAESLAYGGAAAVMLGAAITWFYCFGEVMDEGRLVYLFGRIAPALSLIFSMTLRFVPRFAAKYREVSMAQRALWGEGEKQPLRQRLKRGLHVLSIILTWSLETAVETADAMRSRGYGLPGRTAFSIYRFTSGDAAALGAVLLCGGLAIFAAVSGHISWRYFPKISGSITGAWAAVCGVFFLICITPAALDYLEELRWKRSRLKI